MAIYATVLDRYGEMVRNLERDDFIVEDDGRRQELTVFVEGLQPITAMVLVDTSASMTLNLDLAKTAAEQFVIRMMPGDQVRVGSLSDRLDLSRGSRATAMNSCARCARTCTSAIPPNCGMASARR